MDLAEEYYKSIQNLSGVDKRPKNLLFSLYDMDTQFPISNGVYNEERENWRKEHLKTIKFSEGMSPRGEWYSYAEVYDGHIYAIGEEQGNYAGGDLVSVEHDGTEYVKEYIAVRCKGGLYEKIKDLPVATPQMVKEMKEKLKSFDKN